MFRRGSRFVKSVKKVVGGAYVVVGSTLVTLGSAAICHADFTPPTLSTTEILAIAGAAFTALGAIWFVKKGIKLLNRS